MKGKSGAAESTVHYFSDTSPYREKEELYLKVRRKEERVLNDEEVARLPIINPGSPYISEWRWRRRSFDRFRTYCNRFAASSDKNTPFSLLDLGCGNGWLSNRLAENPGWRVWAIDVNEEELTQGARLFGRTNLRFAYADVLSLEKAFPERFDIIVLAASVQYFPDLTTLIHVLRSMLKPGGEIHLIDSPFYKGETARSAAQQRTKDYYALKGAAEMASWYHHHLWKDVEGLGGENLNDSLAQRFLQKIKWHAPFPWVRVRKENM